MFSDIKNNSVRVRIGTFFKIQNFPSTGCPKSAKGKKYKLGVRQGYILCKILW